MKRILFLLFFCTFALSETILIPEDYATIQEGIDASVDGDTILVANGDYVENLVLDKSILLTSYAIYDNLDEWIIFDEDFSAQWVINNSHIENTRLIGSNPDDPDFGSVILIIPDSDECISPEIVGFTIQGGSGTIVHREVEGGPTENILLGGGILADVSNPFIHHNQFIQNGSDEVYSGGASQMTSSAEDWSFDNRYENFSPRCVIEEFRLSNNLYKNNSAKFGNTLANRFHENGFDMSGSVFDVFDYANIEQSVSQTWIEVEENVNIDYTSGNGQYNAFSESDVYVNPNIDQECLNEGCGLESNPFKTITRTLEMINPTDDNPITIHLINGTYSPLTGENFPFYLIENIILKGETQEFVILDAQQSENIDCEYSGDENCYNNEGVIYISNINEISIQDLTITGGYSQFEVNVGGGLSIRSSTPNLLNLTIFDNHSTNTGGGIHLAYSDANLQNLNIFNNSSETGGGISVGQSNPILTNVNIFDNYAYNWGGGLSLINSNPIILDSKITDNTGEMNVGGLGLLYSNPEFRNVLIADNNGGEYCSGMLLYNSSPALINVTIANNTVSNGSSIFLIASSNPTIINTIIWDIGINSFGLDDEITSDSGMPNITYSNILGGWDGQGNIDSSPLFLGQANGNYNLSPLSPCIDAGLSEIEGMLDVINYFGQAPDIGAFEYDGVNNFLTGDTNFDGIVDILDIVRIVNQIMGNSEFNDDEYTAADFNADSIVDVLDIVQIVNYILP